MKPLRFTTLLNIVHVVLIIATVVTLTIVYRHIDNSYTLDIVIGYVIALLIYAVSLILIGLYKVWQVKWRDLRKIIARAIVVFILSAGVRFLHASFTQSHFGAHDMISAVMLAGGLVIMDIVYFTGKRTTRKNTSHGK